MHQIGNEERLNCYYAQTQVVNGYSLQVSTAYLVCPMLSCKHTD